MQLGQLEIRVDRGDVSWRGRPVDLRPMEYRLLLYLVRNPDRVHTREELLAAVWTRPPGRSTRTVDVHVTRLRRALGEAGDALKTVRSVGYRLDPAHLDPVEPNEPDRR